MGDLHVKGFIIGRYLELARDGLDEAAFSKLETDLGVSLRELKHAYFKDYPVDLQIEVEKRVAEDVWGEDYEKAVYKIGRINFESFRSSAIGRTTLALIGKNPRKIVTATIRLVSTVVSGLVLDVEERGEEGFSVRFRNSPHRPLGWKGTIDASLEHAGVVPEVETIKHGPEDFEFRIGWK